MIDDRCKPKREDLFTRLGRRVPLYQVFVRLGFAAGVQITGAEIFWSIGCRDESRCQISRGHPLDIWQDQEGVLLVRQLW